MLHPHFPWTDPFLTDIPGPLPIPSVQSHLLPQERQDKGPSLTQHQWFNGAGLVSHSLQEGRGLRSPLVFLRVGMSAQLSSANWIFSIKGLKGAGRWTLGSLVSQSHRFQFLPRVTKPCRGRHRGEEADIVRYWQGDRGSQSVSLGQIGDLPLPTASAPWGQMRGLRWTMIEGLHLSPKETCLSSC